jgi:uncharacterized protein YkwD
VPRTPLQALIFLLSMWLALAVLQPLVARGATSGPPVVAASTDPALASLEALLFDSINRVREQEGLVPLRRDPRIDAVARAHSQDMAERGYFSHDTPEGLNPVDRLQRAGVTAMTLAGENVGLTSRNDPNREIVDGWLASPVHRRNLLMPAFNTTGVGIARAPDGTLYYTQLYVTVPR